MIAEGWWCKPHRCIDGCQPLHAHVRLQLLHEPVPEKPQMLAVHSGACNILLVKQCLRSCFQVQGRFLALAGFGNLPGDVVFFDRKSDGRCKQMGAVR